MATEDQAAEGAAELTNDGDGAAPIAYSPDDLATIRELAIQAHPGVIPELVGGDSPTAIRDSIAGAKAAYDRVAANFGPAAAANVSEASPAQPAKPAETAPQVPAGGQVVVTDLSKLPPGEKIRRGLAGRKQ